MKRKMLRHRRLVKKKVEATTAEPSNEPCGESLNITLHGNPSAFAAFAHVRTALLESKAKQRALILANNDTDKTADNSDDDGSSSEQDGSQLKIPKIVGIGLCSVIELIRESCFSHPSLCMKALQALLDILQGQTPESLRHESADVVDSLFSLLMELSSIPTVESSLCVETNSLSSLACACLLSLVVANGETGKLLSAISTSLMCGGGLASQRIKVPVILQSLHRSVSAVLLGTTSFPDWFQCGVRRGCEIDTWHIADMPTGDITGNCYSAITSDGRFLYMHSTSGLYKIGSGYIGTVKGHVYASHPGFHQSERGWLVFTQGMLFYTPALSDNGSIIHIDTDTLQELDTFRLEKRIQGSSILFTDGEHLCILSSSKEDSFVVTCFSITPCSSLLTVVNEIEVKPIRKRIVAYGSCQTELEINTDSLRMSSQCVQVLTVSSQQDDVCDSDVSSLVSGKDFAFCHTVSGKVYYTGKPVSLGIKQGGPVSGKWAELPTPSTAKVKQVCVGHEGQHAVLITEDGAAHCTGSAKRGEDADQSSKARRVSKASKPKKMTKMDGKTVLTGACNSGSSCMVTSEGQIYMFGKDTLPNDSQTGLVSDLKDVEVSRVVLGKAHTCLLSRQGDVYTFGINNKGQCGRETHNSGITTVVNVGTASNAQSTSSVKVSSPVPTSATCSGDESASADESGALCLSGKHNWTIDECLVCTVCCECTGYGANCVNTTLPGRRPGQKCGCGIGDSGCTVCGCCKRCADETKAIIDAMQPYQNITPVEQKVRELVAQKGSQLKPKLLRKHLFRLLASRAYDSSASQSGDDKEQDHSKTVSLSPGEITLPDNIKATQIACGLHHSVVLLDNGQVITFGSGQHGQLGHGDTNNRFSPAIVGMPFRAVQVAAGSNHTVILTDDGHVITFGSYQKGQLGRQSHGESKRAHLWYTRPWVIPDIGPELGRRATWVGASGDMTFINVEECLIRPRMLDYCNVFANQQFIGIIPSTSPTMKCLMIDRQEQTCKCLETDLEDIRDCSIFLDNHFNVLWSYAPESQQLVCYNILHNDATNRPKSLLPWKQCTTLNSELAIPSCPGAVVSRSHAALFLLACVTTLSTAHDINLVPIADKVLELKPSSKVFTKDDYNIVNRFESHGGGWGYSGHSVEAIRFTVDTDVLLGGFGLFGGRGEYTAKIKIYGLGADGGDHEGEGVLLTESEDVVYECGIREKFAVMFEEAVHLYTDQWYVAWSRVSGPSSDCGSNGLATVVTDDGVTFRFLGSRKSNNGTDVSAGQIPQLLCRMPVSETTLNSNTYTTEPVHILSRSFSKVITAETFDSLLKLLQWSWSMLQTSLCDIRDMKSTQLITTLVDIEKLAFLAICCVRLLTTYTCDVYPVTGASRKNIDVSKFSESILQTRTIMYRILSSPVPTSPVSTHHTTSSSCDIKPCDIVNHVLMEAFDSFVYCFHAFYPTQRLQWDCLCLLIFPHIQSGSASNINTSLVLAAVLRALCQPTVKLMTVFPILTSRNDSPDSDRRPSPDDDVITSPRSPDQCSWTNSLVTYMQQQASMQPSRPSDNQGFHEMFDRILHVLISPIQVKIQQLQEPSCATTTTRAHPQLLVSNCGTLISLIVGELVTLMSSRDSESDGPGAVRPVKSTPSRFGRCSQIPCWNTGQGSPDAICFTVDRSNVVIAGATVYGGGGTHNYELELLADTESAGDQGRRWNSLELVKDTYTPAKTSSDVVEIKFDRPVSVREGMKYALRLRNHGGRTANGDNGMVTVKTQDGITFKYSSCTLSSNGTNACRGQIPQILYYYNCPGSQTQGHKVRATSQDETGRQCLMDVTTSLVKSASRLLTSVQLTNSHAAQANTAPSLRRLLSDTELFADVLPTVFAKIAPVAAVDPKFAVDVVGLVKELLPTVANLNVENLTEQQNEPNNNVSCLTTSNHYAIVQSDHPYKPATVMQYKVQFADSVKYLSLEFDSQCGTAQTEDYLNVYTPESAGYEEHRTPLTQPRAPHTHPCHRRGSVKQTSSDTQRTDSMLVVGKYSGSSNWPQTAILLPGNEVLFSLETASDYVKDDHSCFYGFKCTVVGYEWPSNTNDVLVHLERELCYLASTCASSLMRRDLKLNPGGCEDSAEDVLFAEESAKTIFATHSALLKNGFALSHPATVFEALDGSLPYATQSTERTFLNDFISCIPDTSGGRLAVWLQPEPYIDPCRCVVIVSKEDVKCGWPTVVIVQTKDQYGQPAFCRNLKVEMQAVPLQCHDQSGSQADYIACPDSLTFGGHPVPNTNIPYEPRIKDNLCYTSISMMKGFENYSFEEIRYATPAVRKPSENMLVRSNNNATYTATWTPGSVGLYGIQVTIDGFETGEMYQVNVGEPPLGVTLPNMSTTKKCHQPSKLRKFEAVESRGLRIRAAPSLQSEGIGVLPPGHGLSFVDEATNDDGMWLCLSLESIKEYCSSNGCQEAWCLSFNQNLGKTLLFPAEENHMSTTLPSMSGFIERVSIQPFPVTDCPEPTRPLASLTAPKRAGPGIYHVVKCGSSGHNIRCGPSLKAAPIGMLVLSNKLIIVDELLNTEGTWLKLDQESMRKYCEKHGGEAWSLASNTGGTTYLMHESMLSEIERQKFHPFLTSPVNNESQGSNTQLNMNGASSNVCVNSPGADTTPVATGMNRSKPVVDRSEPFSNSLPSNNAFCFSQLHNNPPSAPLPGGNHLKVPHKFLRQSGVAGSRGSGNELMNTMDCGDGQAESSDSEASLLRKTEASNDISNDDGGGATRGQFNIGSPLGSPKLSPKSSPARKLRLMRKREKIAYPTLPPNLPTSRDDLISKDRPKDGVSPSEAECVRAIFAAFLWYHGIVHDAMACASFLKFHPNLAKELPAEVNSRLVTLKEASSPRDKDPLTSAGGGSHQSDTLLEHYARQTVAKALVLNKNETKIHDEEPASSFTGKGGGSQEQRGASVGGPSMAAPSMAAPSMAAPPAAIGRTAHLKLDPKLPSTMQYLVAFWEEISKCSMKIILQHFVFPSPTRGAPRTATKHSDKYEQSRAELKKGKKKRERLSTGKGNLFGEAAGAPPAGNEKQAKCELCGGSYPYPVTYHMKQNHPGCGRHSGGQGYNTAGTYCSGWAGNCNDGGIGGSSWYLLCEQCREKYLKEKQTVHAEKMKKKLKKRPAQLTKRSGEPTPALLEAHKVMKNNATFLLEFASSSVSQVTSRQKRDGQSGSLTLGGFAESPESPVTQFKFLPNSSRTTSSVTTLPNTNRMDIDISPPPSHVFQTRSGSMESHQVAGLLTPESPVTQPVSLAASPIREGETATHCLFQRSISMSAAITTREPAEGSEDGFDSNYKWPGADKYPPAKRRTRIKSASSNKESGLSLLRHPSQAMAKVINDGLYLPEYTEKTLQRPLMSFIVQRHDLSLLRLAIRHALRKGACRVFAIETFQWLFYNVTQLMCVHDILWFFVSSLSTLSLDSVTEEETQDDVNTANTDETNKEVKKPEEQESTFYCDHPISDIAIAGDATYPLPNTIHNFLQTVSDMMMMLPNGSALQQMAVRCWNMQFCAGDHVFLHRSHVFTNISKILSRTDSDDPSQGDSDLSCMEHSIISRDSLQGTPVVSPKSHLPRCKVECFQDISSSMEIKASSRVAMVTSLTDNSTETFWESGDEDRNRVKTLTVSVTDDSVVPLSVAVHIDNTRDIQSKVTTVIFLSGRSPDEVEKLKQTEIDSRFVGWTSCRLGHPLTAESHDSLVIKLQLKGSYNTLRVRQIKLIGYKSGDVISSGDILPCSLIQQQNCEQETLRVFRLLTSQVFGKLLAESEEGGEDEDVKMADTSPKSVDTPDQGSSSSDVNLREHMVGILFSRSKLTNLQKQMCSHIVHSIRRETTRVRDQWENSMLNGNNQPDAGSQALSDAYCFELLSMVLALSGSEVGRSYIARQQYLMMDLMTLLHTATPRVQRQVTSLLRRILPEVTPEQLAAQMSVLHSPLPIRPVFYSPPLSSPTDPSCRNSVLDILLAVIAKSLSLQMRTKGRVGGNGNRGVSLVTIATLEVTEDTHWYMRGSIPQSISCLVIKLIKDMSMGHLSPCWAIATKSAISETVLSLAKIEEEKRVPESCLKTHTLWLSVAALCVLDQQLVDMLTSGQWVCKKGAQPKLTCDNHDDDETQAIVMCNQCGSLCADCDRFLHLNRRTKQHQRQVVKEEEEAIKVDLHEGCGRAKLLWLMALIDPSTLKAVVEFRHNSHGSVGSPSSRGSTVCRFCGSQSTTTTGLASSSVCSETECLQHANNACTQHLQCGHLCGGIRDETVCLPCLHGCESTNMACSVSAVLKQDADDMCMICFTDALACAPAIQLECGHVFHYHCCRKVLENRWPGPRITFSFSQCPICKNWIRHQILDDQLKPVRGLYEDVKKKSLMRLGYEGLNNCEAITTPGARFYNDPTGFGMNRYAYYVCFKCEKAYYGGEARCDNDAGAGENYDPSELVCGACSDVSRAQICPKHGTDYLEYKCRYCCSVAVFFCFGTTHFCQACHDDFQRVTNMAKHDLPHCPAGARGRQLEGDECPLHVEHPPTGEEFALGCGICRNAHTF